MKPIVNILIVVLLAVVLYAMFFVDLTSKSEVTTPEIKKTGNYQHPVREGNCWRQFTATDSILVCG